MQIAQGPLMIANLKCVKSTLHIIKLRLKEFTLVENDEKIRFNLIKLL